jgi:hypothetical protein
MATAVILDTLGNKAKRIEAVDYPLVKIVEPVRQVRINDILPFRVKFSNIQIEGYSSTNIPPIPLQVIGFSNYIL